METDQTMHAQTSLQITIKAPSAQKTRGNTTLHFLQTFNLRSQQWEQRFSTHCLYTHFKTQKHAGHIHTFVRDTFKRGCNGKREIFAVCGLMTYNKTQTI